MRPSNPKVTELLVVAISEILSMVSLLAGKTVQYPNQRGPTLEYLKNSSKKMEQLFGAGGDNDISWDHQRVEPTKPRNIVRQDDGCRASLVGCGECSDAG